MQTAAARPKACVFDAYGTLFDYSSAAAKCSAVLGPKAEWLTRIWREKQLQYTWLRSLEGRHADFRQVTGDALDYTLASLEIDVPGLREKLMDSYLTLDAFPEVTAVLGRLRQMGIRTAILSNGSPEMLETAVSRAGIGELLDEVLSVEEVGVYKPHPKVYQLAVDRLRMEISSIAFVSSNGWDAWAAAAFGMKVVWCNRYGQQPERLPGRPDSEIQSLTDLPFLFET